MTAGETALTRMGIDRSARDSPFKPEGGGFDSHQSPVVLGVKPAVEDVDVRLFLAFQRTLVKDQIEPNKFLLTRLETCCYNKRKCKV